MLASVHELGILYSSRLSQGYRPVMRDGELGDKDTTQDWRKLRTLSFRACSSAILIVYPLKLK